MGQHLGQEKEEKEVGKEEGRNRKLEKSRDKLYTECLG